MNSKERMKALLRGKAPDRVGKAEAPWPEARQRWAKEGLPAGVHANDHFRMDLRHMIRVDLTLGLGEQIVEDGGDWQIVRTSEGGTTKVWKHTGIPHPLTFGITSPADWRRLRERLVPSRERLAFGYYGDYGYEYVTAPFEAVKAAYDRCPTRRSTCVALSVQEPFEGLLSKLGDEQLLTLMITEPAWINEMFAAVADLAIKMVDFVLELGFEPDAVFVGGDLAYKGGLLFSPAVYRSLLGPHHKRLFSHYHSRGLPIIYHSCGDVREAIPLLIESGIDCLQPLEARTGMDVRDLAKRYGDRIAFMGNISVENLARGGQPMRDEVAGKVGFMAANRFRYICHSDHSLPGDCSLANFTEAMELVAEHGAYA